MAHSVKAQTNIYTCIHELLWSSYTSVQKSEEGAAVKKRVKNALEKESVKSVQQEYKKLRATLRYIVEPVRIDTFKHISVVCTLAAAIRLLIRHLCSKIREDDTQQSGKMTHSNNNMCNPYILQFKVTIVTKYLFL